MDNEVDNDFFDKLDHSVLQQPFDIGVKHVNQIISCIQNGNSEVQNILLNECTIIYECKVCLNLFRSLPNLIAHKRFYCKEQFCETLQHSTIVPQESTLVIQPEDPPEIELREEELSPEDNEDSDDESHSIRFESPPIFHSQSKDSSFQRKTRSLDDLDGNQDTSDHEAIDDDTTVNTIIELKKIKGNTNAVYMSVALPESLVTSQLDTSNEEERDNMQGETEEPVIVKGAPMPSRRKQLMKMSTCCVKTLTCLICKTSYTTIKTLYSHMKSIHAKKRMYYPCPLCKTAFVQMWGVTRHMTTVHHKSKEQINKYRDIIKKRAYVKRVMGNSSQPSSHLGSPKQNTIKVEPEPPAEVGQNKDFICKKCGRVFDRASSKVNHEKFCTPGNSANTSASDSKKKPGTVVANPENLSSDQSTEPKDKANPSTMHKCFKCGRSFARKSSQLTHTKFCKGKVQATQIKTTLPPPKIKVEPNPEDRNLNVMMRPRRVIIKKEDADFVSSQTLKWRSANKVESVDNSKPQQTYQPTQKTTSQEKSDPLENIQELKDVNNVEKKVLSIINIEKLTCLKCKQTFSSFSNAKRHAAHHIGWMRFKCKHCSYKAYNKSDCRNHIERVHTNKSPVSDLSSGLLKGGQKKSPQIKDDKPCSPQKLDKSPIPCVSVRKLDLHGQVDSINISSYGLQNEVKKSFSPLESAKKKKSASLNASIEKIQSICHKGSDRKVHKSLPLKELAEKTQSAYVKGLDGKIRKSMPLKTPTGKIQSIYLREAAARMKSQSSRYKSVPIKRPKPLILKSPLKTLSFKSLHGSSKEECEKSKHVSSKGSFQDVKVLTRKEGTASNTEVMQDSTKVKERNVQSSGSSEMEHAKSKILTHFDVADTQELALQSLLESANELFELDSADEEDQPYSPTEATAMNQSSWRKTTTSPFITKLTKTSPTSPPADQTTPAIIKITAPQKSGTEKETSSVSEQDSANLEPVDVQAVETMRVSSPQAENVQGMKYPSLPTLDISPKKFVVKASPQRCIVKPPSKKCALTSVPEVEESGTLSSSDHAYMASSPPTVVLLNASGPQNNRTFTFSVVKDGRTGNTVPANYPKKYITIVKKAVADEPNAETVEPSVAETEAAVQSVVEEQLEEQMDTS